MYSALTGICIKHFQLHPFHPPINSTNRPVNTASNSVRISSKSISEAAACTIIVFTYADTCTPLTLHTQHTHTHTHTILHTTHTQHTRNTHTHMHTTLHTTHTQQTHTHDTHTHTRHTHTQDTHTHKTHTHTETNPHSLGRILSSDSRLLNCFLYMTSKFVIRRSSRTSMMNLSISRIFALV